MGNTILSISFSVPAGLTMVSYSFNVEAAASFTLR